MNQPKPVPTCYPVYILDGFKHQNIFYASNATKALDFAMAFNKAGLERNGCYLGVSCPLPAGAKLDSYRGWTFDFEYGYHTAIHDNYDAEWRGEEDGWVDNGLKESARTLADLLLELSEITI